MCGRVTRLPELSDQSVSAVNPVGERLVETKPPDDSLINLRWAWHSLLHAKSFHKFPDLTPQVVYLFKQSVCAQKAVVRARRADGFPEERFVWGQWSKRPKAAQRSDRQPVNERLGLTQRGKNPDN